MNAKSFMIFLQIFLMCTIFVLLRHPAEAGIVTDRFPLQTYVDHQVDTYNNPGDARRAGYASANVDLIRVLEFRSDGWVRVQHPAGKNNRIVNRWCRITDLCADPNYSNRGVRVSGSHTVYRTRNNNVKFGSISNEEVIVLADNGSRAQILYRLDNGQGYKMGWVASSAVNSRTVQGNTINTNPIVQPAVRQTSNVVAPANGDYYLIPEANGGFALDVKGGGDAPEQTPLQLYNRHGEDAQIFTIQSIGGGWYTIKHKRTGRCVNVSWGSPNNGTGLWLYRDDGTASCHWRFLDAGNGSYNIQSRLSGNPILELQNNNVYAGGRIQLWQKHSGQAGRWKLVSVQAVPQPVIQEQTGYIKTNGANLNFRQTPNGTILGKLSNGTPVTILQHPATNGWSRIRYNGKEGYVASQYVSTDSSPVPSTTQGSVSPSKTQNLDNLINEWDAYNKTRKWNGSGQCFGFANYIFEKLHGVTAGTIQNGPTLSNPSAGVKHLFLSYDAVIDKEAVKDVFLTKARPGDFVISSRPHSMIFVKYDANARAIWVLDANWAKPQDNIVRYHSFTLDKFCTNFRQFSIYTK